MKPLFEAAASTTAVLPDSPGAVAAGSSSSSRDTGIEGSSLLDLFSPQDQQKPPGTPGSPLPREASPTDPVVVAGQTAPHQTSRDKIVGSVKDAISPFSLVGDVFSAGYSHAVDSSPHYGVDGAAFAQRFGAAVARDTSQTLFANGALAAILHEDTRYYQLGPGHPILHRAFNAAIWPFVVRTDGGRRTPNFAVLGGYLGSAALTPVYYPPRDQTFGDVAQVYGGSIAGTVIGRAVDEFLPQVLQAVHLTRLDRTRH